MAQLIDPIPSDQSEFICCCYVNGTSKIQVARITNIPNWYFERVVFPGQRLLFETLPEAQLEIHTGMMASSILSDTIPCTRLQIDEDDIVKDSYSPEKQQGLEAQNEGIVTRSSMEASRLDVFPPEPLKIHAVQAL
ncbi:MAG: DUF1830 domain-containing protein [Thermosynechococcaceae cyanobacterium]